MRQRVPVFVHQQYASDMPPLLAAGASGFLHGRLGPELTAGVAEATARARAFVVPNLGLGALRRETIGNDPFLAQVLPPEVSTRLSTATSGRRNPAAGSPQQDTDVRAAMDRLLSAGVDIVLGTDAGALPDHPFGYTGHRELEIFVRLGMTPMQALVAATGAAARHLRQPDLGVLAPGRRANLLVLSANPLADIRNTRQIDAVYLGVSGLIGRQSPNSCAVSSGSRRGTNASEGKRLWGEQGLRSRLSLCERRWGGRLSGPPVGPCCLQESLFTGFVGMSRVSNNKVSCLQLLGVIAEI